jgi:hypothetical protein
MKARHLLLQLMILIAKSGTQLTFILTKIHKQIIIGLGITINVRNNNE